jgi:hypothetical protein
MTKKKNRLGTSAKPLAALTELDNAEAAKVNGGIVFGVVINPHPPVFGVIVKPPHHHHKPKKPPFFGVPIHP